MNTENDDKPGLLDELKNTWKTASGGKKAMWLALALLTTWFMYEFKKSWDKIRSERNK